MQEMDTWRIWRQASLPGIYEEELPVSISGKEWLAAHDEHWDSATQVILASPPLM